jgi:virginiamycin A acetyltransferase
MRKAIKGIIIGIFYILTLPCGLLARGVYRLIGSPFFFEIFSEGLSIIPGRPGKYVRTCFYHQTLNESHLDTEYCFGCIINKLETSIGRRCGIGVLTTVGYCRIGDDSVIANGVSLLSGRKQHNFDDPSKAIFSRNEDFSELSIGRNVFVGEGAVVMADIGDCTIVGAGSVVVKELPAYTIAVGNPARVVKERPRPDVTPVK